MLLGLCMFLLVGIVNAANETIFYDGFEKWVVLENCNQNNSGWTACYDGGGGVATTNNVRKEGVDSLYINNQDAGTGYLIKCLDLTDYSTAYLQFWWDTVGLDSGEQGNVSINTSSSSYESLFEANNNTVPDLNWNYSDLDITPYISSDTCIKFHSQSSLISEHFRVDEVYIVGEPLPPPQLNITSISKTSKLTINKGGKLTISK